MQLHTSIKQLNQLLAELRRAVPESSSSQTANPATKPTISFPRFTDPQKLAWKCVEKTDRRTLCLAWGRGCGKSAFLRWVCWILVARWDGVTRAKANGETFKGVRIIWLMPTLKQFKAVHGSSILNELGGKWAALEGKLDRTSWQITFPGGSTIIPFPAAEYNSKTARGMRADVIVGDECDDIDPAVYDAVAQPWLSEPWSFGLSLLGGTPRRGRHGLLWRMFELGQRGAKARAGQPVEGDLKTLAKFFSYRSTYRDVPDLVSAEAVADAKATTIPETFRREWEADFDAGEGLVYAFDPDLHVKPAPPLGAFQEFVVGVDWGWTDPAVMLLIGIQGHGNDASAWVLDEFYETQAPLDKMQDVAKRWSSARTVFHCDPSRPDSIRALQQVCSAVKAENDIMGGVARVATLLARRTREQGADYTRFHVAPHCKNTIREFGLYRRKRDPQNPDGFLEKPEDKNNHAMDAARYGIVGRFQVGGPRSIVSGR